MFLGPCFFGRPTQVFTNFNFIKIRCVFATVHELTTLSHIFLAFDFISGMISILPNVIDQDTPVATQVVSYKGPPGIPALPYKLNAYVVFEYSLSTKMFTSPNIPPSSVVQACDSEKAFSSYVPDKMSPTLTYKEVFDTPDYVTALESFYSVPPRMTTNTYLF